MSLDRPIAASRCIVCSATFQLFPSARQQRIGQNLTDYREQGMHTAFARASSLEANQYLADRLSAPPFVRPAQPYARVRPTVLPGNRVATTSPLRVHQLSARCSLCLQQRVAGHEHSALRNLTRSLRNISRTPASAETASRAASHRSRTQRYGCSRDSAAQHASQLSSQAKIPALAEPQQDSPCLLGPTHLSAAPFGQPTRALTPASSGTDKCIRSRTRVMVRSAASRGAVFTRFCAAARELSPAPEGRGRWHRPAGALGL